MGEGEGGGRDLGANEFVSGSSLFSVHAGSHRPNFPADWRVLG